MNGYNIWVWLLIGVVPYHITYQHAKHGRVVKVRALFWSLEIHLQPEGEYQWSLHIPLIEQLRK